MLLLCYLHICKIHIASYNGKVREFEDVFYFYFCGVLIKCALQFPFPRFKHQLNKYLVNSTWLKL